MNATYPSRRSRAAPGRDNFEALAVGHDPRMLGTGHGRHHHHRVHAQDIEPCQPRGTVREGLGLLFPVINHRAVPRHRHIDQPVLQRRSHEGIAHPVVPVPDEARRRGHRARPPVVEPAPQRMRRAQPREPVHVVGLETQRGLPGLVPRPRTELLQARPEHDHPHGRRQPVKAGDLPDQDRQARRQRHGHRAGQRLPPPDRTESPRQRHRQRPGDAQGQERAPGPAGHHGREQHHGHQRGSQMPAARPPPQMSQSRGSRCHQEGHIDRHGAEQEEQARPGPPPRQHQGSRGSPHEQQQASGAEIQMVRGDPGAQEHPGKERPGGRGYAAREALGAEHPFELWIAREPAAEDLQRHRIERIARLHPGAHRVAGPHQSGQKPQSQGAGPPEEQGPPQKSHREPGQRQHGMLRSHPHAERRHGQRHVGRARSPQSAQQEHAAEGEHTGHQDVHVRAGQEHGDDRRRQEGERGQRGRAEGRSELAGRGVHAQASQERHRDTRRRQQDVAPRPEHGPGPQHLPRRREIFVITPRIRRGLAPKAARLHIPARVHEVIGERVPGHGWRHQPAQEIQGEEHAHRRQQPALRTEGNESLAHRGDIRLQPGADTVPIPHPPGRDPRQRPQDRHDRSPEQAERRERPEHRHEHPDRGKARRREPDRRARRRPDRPAGDPIAHEPAHRGARERQAEAKDEAQ